MLSFKVKYAIQILAELEDAGRNDQRLLISEIKERGGFESRGLTVTLSALRQRQWVRSINNRYCIVIDLTQTTLYDLAMAMDEGLYMGTNILIEGWTFKNREGYAHAITFDKSIEEGLERQFMEIRLSDFLPRKAKMLVANHGCEPISNHRYVPQVTSSLRKQP